MALSIYRSPDNYQIHEDDDVPEKKRKKMRPFPLLTCLETLGAILLILALALIALGFATDHWQEYTVNRGSIDVANLLPDQLEGFTKYYVYYSRDRGLFRVCIEGTESSILETAYDPEEWTVTDTNCIREEGYDFNQREIRGGWGSDYETRNHLLRFLMALFAMVLLLIIVTIVIGAMGCWYVRTRYLYTAGLLCLVAGILGAAAMGVFHAIKDLEDNGVDQWPYKKSYPPALNDITDEQYGYSYIISWIGVGLLFIACIVYLIAGYKAVERKEAWREKHYPEPDSSIIELPRKPATLPPPTIIQAPPQIIQAAPQVIPMPATQTVVMQPQPVMAVQEPIVLGPQPMMQPMMAPQPPMMMAPPVAPSVIMAPPPMMPQPMMPQPMMMEPMMQPMMMEQPVMAYDMVFDPMNPYDGMMMNGGGMMGGGMMGPGMMPMNPYPTMGPGMMQPMAGPMYF